jgi:hypothetical protein
MVMSTNPIPQSRGNDATTLKVQPGDQLDRATTPSLQEVSTSESTAADAIRRNPRSALLAFAGVAALVGSSIWLLASFGQRSRRD